jgi:hypothetical protein
MVSGQGHPSMPPLTAVGAAETAGVPEGDRPAPSAAPRATARDSGPDTIAASGTGRGARGPDRAGRRRPGRPVLAGVGRCGRDGWAADPRISFDREFRPVAEVSPERGGPRTRPTGYAGGTIMSPTEKTGPS